MNSEDKTFSRILKTIDVVVEPPDALKQKVYQSLFIETTEVGLNHSYIASFLFEKSLRFIIPLSILISLLLNIFAPMAAF